MFPIEIVTLALIIIINMVIVWILASQSWHVTVYRYFILAVSFVILWAFGTTMLMIGSSNEQIVLGRILFLIAPMYTILFLSLFAAVFPATKGKSFTLFNKFLTVLTVGFSLFILVRPELLLVTTGTYNNFNIITVDTFWYSAYTLYFNTAFLITFTEFFLHIRKTRGSQRQQLLYVFSGTLLAAIFSLVTNLSLPILGASSYIWLGPTWTLFYILTVSISIVKHQLFDIKLAAVRTVAYIGALFTLSGIYFLVAYLLSFFLFNGGVTDSVSVSPVNVVVALALAFIFQPIKRFFDRATNSIFYRQEYKSEDFINKFSELLTSTIDLRGLLEQSSRYIESTFKSDQVFFFLYFANSPTHHMSAGTHGHAKLPVYDAHSLDEYVRNSQHRIILTNLINDNISIQRMLKSHRVAAVVPLWQGERIAGYVFLGDRLAGIYTKRDLTMLTTISNELVIAIQNAISLHEVKELNATLQQRVDVATKELRSSNAQLKHLDQVKDEFMSMASHQLRTPLTSIKGYLSMVLEGDAGKITSQQEKLLLEAFNSSERMVRLISDFLNVSRMQTGKFLIEKTTFDLRDIVRQEVKELELLAASHAMKLRMTVGKDPLVVEADADKIRQVMMNFIDNAIYYSNPKSTIIVNLERVKHTVAFTVVDGGIGVPEDEQKKLFTKFFRAQNARKQRPDGTGVGLYLARRVIMAHSGAIIFSSKEGRGSTFGFQLPLDTTEKLDKKPVPELVNTTK